MKGKADKLVANRTLSALAVVCLVISAFAGLLLMTDMTPTRAAEGDLIVQNGTYIIENSEQPIDGNVEVRVGGELIIRDATLSIISNNASGLRHTITVFAGGKLTLDHGAITPYLDQINPWPFLNINVQGNGRLIASNNSLLMFPGNITLTTGAFVSLTDTEIMALPDELVAQYVIGSGGIAFDSADDGPAITLTDSTMELYDSSIFDLPEYPTTGKAARDLSLNGESKLLAVNSYIGVDFGPAQVAADWYVHNRLVLSGISVAHLYGCSFETYTGQLADRAPAIVANGDSYVASPNAKEIPPGDTTVGQSVSSLLVSGDGMTYHVSPGERMGIDSFNAGTPGLTVDSANLLVRYKVDPGYAGTEPLRWSTNEGGSWSSTGITPLSSELSFVEKSYDLHAAGVTTTNALAALDVTFLHNGVAAQIQFDSMSIVVSIGPSAYIYRWLNVTVGDEYGVPVPNATISAVFTGSSSYGGQPSFYFGADGAKLSPPAEVLAYIGKTPSTFSVTESDGIVAIPYLTDIMTASEAPDSLFVGMFDITGTWGTFSSTDSFSFPAYPAMTHADQSFDFTVSLIGLSAESPDPSRWLVVPPSLSIKDMTYYHAGDVIVAAGGTLSFTNSVFQLVQPGSYTKTIYVDGTATTPAKLVFSKSRVTSQYPINIIVKGDGILEAYDTVMEGVDIIIEENATVLFSNVVMDGRITTAWDAWTENVSIRDSDLSQVPELSGSVVAGFTNTSVPAISVTGDAIALIYRWIHVTVLDGAGMPLPGVNVSTRYYIEQNLSYQPEWALSSAAPDSLGVAKVNSLGTIKTSTASTFVGNYWVNATYTYAGKPYYADNSSGEREISLSVRPYETPLGRNATFATMTIPDALCDLSVNQAYTPVWAVDSGGHDITNPRMGQTVTINGRINNTGVASAYNVTVEFFDDTSGDSQPQDNELFATRTVPVIMAGSSAVVSAYWTAVGLIDPDVHRILVVADRSDRVPEIDDLTPAIGIGILTIKSLADIKVTAGTLGAPDIKASTDFVIVGIQCNLLANIYNDGDNESRLVYVDFFDGTNLVGTTTVNQIQPYGNSLVASVPWIPTGPGLQHSIRVVATLEAGYEETSYTNNEDWTLIKVYDNPNLALTSIKTIPALSVPGGDTVTVTAQLENLHEAPFENPSMRLSVTWPGGSIPVDTWNLEGVSLTSSSGAYEVTRSFTAPIVTATIQLSIDMRVNPADNPHESDQLDNVQQMVLNVTDVRPDLSIVSSDIYVQRGTSDVTGDIFGHQVNVRALVRNLGGSDVDAFNATIGVRNAGDYNHTLSSNDNYNISANATKNTLLITYQWTIKLTTLGAYEIWVVLDGEKSIGEPNEANNFAVAPFNITSLSADVTVSTDFTEYNAGEMMVISATIMYAGSSDPVVDLPGVVFWLLDSQGAVVPGSNSSVKTTDEFGSTSALLRIPTTLDTGTYRVRAVVLETNYDNSSTTVHVSAQVSGGLFPWWVWVLIIVAVVGVVAGFTVYTYIYGLGKLVECGECGAFIPAASKRCPKCGVEFEAGTMKCSECGAWIPAESTECPNCGVKFAGEAEEDADYLERMKKEYDEMVSKYRELAKPELGKKFSEKAFETWWKAQPGFITFDDWLAKEEEKKKEGPVPCPVCGTLNPKEASVCHKCGTVFGAVKPAGAPPKKGPPPAGPTEGTPVEGAPLTEERESTQAQQMPPAMAPRMVIRRPIDRKVVPKKIIKTPVSGEEKNEGGGEEENQ